MSEISRPSIKDLEQAGAKGFRPSVYKSLTEFEDSLPEGNFIGWCEGRLTDGLSLRAISRTVGVAHTSLSRFLKTYGVNIPTQTEASSRSLKGLHQDPEFTARATAAGNEASRRKWEDPDFRRRRSEEVKKQWENPEFRDSVSNAARQNAAKTILNPAFDEKRIIGTRKAVAERWADPEYRQRETARLRKVALDNWTDPDFRKKQSEKMLRQWEDLGFRARHTERSRAQMIRLWEDSDFRTSTQARMVVLHEDSEFQAAHAERMARRWENDDYRAKVTEALRQATEARIQLGQLPLESIHGLRRDVEFYAFSTWEANLARVLTYMGWTYDVRTPFELEIPTEFQELYNMPDISVFYIDFVTVSPKGGIKANEIMVHPRKNPRGWVKVELFREQYPDIPLRLITGRYYEILERRYRSLIEADSRFCGWETKDDNLYTNPARFS